MKLSKRGYFPYFEFTSVSPFAPMFISSGLNTLREIIV
jgi:hypothetical protein